jgi:hypothetical protein
MKPTWSFPGQRQQQNDRGRLFFQHQYHNDHRPIRAETRASLVTAIAKGRHWLDELIGGRITSVEEIAATESCTIRQVNMTISLAFLAPSLVQAAGISRKVSGSLRSQIPC